MNSQILEATIVYEPKWYVVFNDGEAFSHDSLQDAEDFIKEDDHTNYELWFYHRQNVNGQALTQLLRKVETP